MSVLLRVVQGRPQGKHLLFTHREYVFGRGAECHVRPNSDWVSRQHCLLRVTPEVVSIRDLGSRNGTLVNGTRLVDECALHHGDLVEVGPLVFEVQFEGERPTVGVVIETQTLSCDAGDTATLNCDTGTDDPAINDPPATMTRDEIESATPPKT